MRRAFLCHEVLLLGRKKPPAASRISIRSVSRVRENTYLLMCLFLLSVATAPTEPLWSSRVTWQGFIRMLCLCLFSDFRQSQSELCCSGVREACSSWPRLPPWMLVALRRFLGPCPLLG